MRRGILRKALALLLLHTLWPTLALAQSPKAGVVTTLHGVATVARLAAPPEIPLRFKDDVLFRDRITTREDSVVRVLLGGKALVTVRELSVLTISEEPDKATVELQAGKIALAVARQRLRPGEQIEIRTPNAIAGVRGTVVIVEVLRATAQGTTCATAPITATGRVTASATVLRTRNRATPSGVYRSPTCRSRTPSARSLRAYRNTRARSRAVSSGRASWSRA